MVTSVMRALLLQAFLAFHVHATLSAADLKRGHEALKKLLEDEKKVLCGSTQIFDSLKESSTQQARVIQWEYIDEVAKHNLGRYNEQMIDIKTKIEKKKKEIDDLEGNTYDQYTDDEMTNLIKEALKIGFGPEDDMEKAYEIAKFSGCGLKSRRATAKGFEWFDHKKDKTTYDWTEVEKKTYDAFRQTDLQKQIDPRKLQKTCEIMLPKKDEEYCEQMCTKIAEIGGQISHAKYPMVVGDMGNLKTELQRLIELGKKVEEDYHQCTNAHTMLMEFKESLDPLNKQVDFTFTQWKNAKRKLAMAKEEMEDLGDEITDNTEISLELDQKLQGTGEELEKAQKALKSLQDENAQLTELFQNTLATSEDVKRTLLEFMNALKAAEEIKAKIILVLSQLKFFYQMFVNEFISNAGFDDEECIHPDPEAKGAGCLDAFNPDSEDYKTTDKKGFVNSMAALQEYCTTEALPAFKKVLDENGLDLTPLCNLGSSPTESVVEAVDSHRIEVESYIRKTIGYWRDFDPEPSEEENVNLHGPDLLNPVMKEYQKAQLVKGNYLPDWKTNGRFVTAIGKLAQMETNMKAEQESLKEQIAALKQKMADTANKLALAQAAVEAAIDANKIAEEEAIAARELLAELEANKDKLTSNIEQLDTAVKEAYKVYVAAIAEFDRTFKQGVSFVQTGDLPSVSSLKPITRLN